MVERRTCAFLSLVSSLSRARGLYSPRLFLSTFPELKVLVIYSSLRLRKVVQVPLRCCVSSVLCVQVSSEAACLNRLLPLARRLPIRWSSEADAADLVSSQSSSKLFNTTLPVPQRDAASTHIFPDNAEEKTQTVVQHAGAPSINEFENVCLGIPCCLPKKRHEPPVFSFPCRSASSTAQAELASHNVAGYCCRPEYRPRGFQHPASGKRDKRGHSISQRCCCSFEIIQSCC